MQQQTIEYAHNNQKLIGEFFYDEQADKPRSTIIVFPAFEGRGDFAFEYARCLAGEGYNTFLADIYGDGVVGDTIEDCFKDRKSTRLNSSHVKISYAVFC